MGSVILPQGQMVHCQSEEPHDVHPNAMHPGSNVWCNGVPELEPFIELTIRMPIDAMSHGAALMMVEQRGLGMFVDGLHQEGTATVLRVRTGDGKDKWYPVIDRNGRLAAVLDAPQ